MPSSHRVEIVNVGRRVDRDLDAEWQTLRQQAPTSTPFSRIEFARAYAKAMDLGLVLCKARTNAGELSAGVLGYLRRLGPFEKLVVPPFIQYTPLLLAQEPAAHEVHSGDSVVQAILTALGKRFGAAALHLQPEMQDLRPAVWAGFRVKPFYTYRIPLDGTESVQDGWSANAQRLFGKFTSAYEVSEDPVYAKDVIDLCTLAYDRHGRRLPVDATRLQELAGHLHEAGMANVYALHSTSEGTCEAGVVTLHDGYTAHYWIAGSRPGPAMTVLLGHVLQRLSASGVALFDFVGANTPSIAEFKRRFGPQLTPYYRVERTSAVALKVLDLVRGRGG